MATETPTAPAAEQLFIPIGDFRLYPELPGRTRAYELHKLGLLELIRMPNGKVGITAAERQRYINRAQSITAAKPDRTNAIAASLRSRGETGRIRLDAATRFLAGRAGQ